MFGVWESGGAWQYEHGVGYLYAFLRNYAGAPEDSTQGQRLASAAIAPFLDTFHTPHSPHSLFVNQMSWRGYPQVRAGCFFFFFFPPDSPAGYLLDMNTNNSDRPALYLKHGLPTQWFNKDRKAGFHYSKWPLGVVERAKKHWNSLHSHI